MGDFVVGNQTGHQKPNSNGMARPDAGAGGGGGGRFLLPGPTG